MPTKLHIVAAVALGVGACLSVPTGPQAACSSDSDCDHALGEVCEQGACWGGPPTGQFAAIAAPPSDRPDLISVEIPQQILPSDGDFGDVALGAAVTISGRIEPYCAAPAMCADTTIAATVTVSRPSSFPGGPGFTAVATAKGGVARGTDSFSVAVPPTGAGDAPFTVTIVPQGTGAAPPNDGSTSPAELAPPARFKVAAQTDTELGTITLGSESSAVIAGTLTDAQSQPLAKYRVVALGHLDASAPLTEVSTVDYSADGTYSITLADCPSGQTCDSGLSGTIAIEAAPYDPTVTAPTLETSALQPGTGTHVLAQPDYMGNKLAATIPIQGLGGNGAVVPVSGARVIVTATYAPTSDLTRAVFEADAQTGDDGIANLALLDGDAFSGGYTIRIIPPAGSTLGVYEQPLAIADATTPIRLPARLALSGTVVDSEGHGVGNIGVTATPSLRFQWSLDADGQSFLAEIPPATAVTDAAGAFSVSVDPIIETVWGYYDLDFTAPQGVQSADWTHPDVAVPRQGTLAALALGTEPLPATAYMHGVMVDAAGISIGGAALRVFQVATDTSLCAMVSNPPDGCAIPAELLGHATSGDDGTVQLALPRNPAAE